jgi:FkbM family methyltransferase
MVNLLKKLFPRISVAGEPPPEPLAEFTMAAALSRVARRGVSFKTIIDVGASDGRWADLALSAFPGKECLLLEANAVHEASLRLFCSNRVDCRYQLIAAGGHDGHLYFDASDPMGGQASQLEDDNHALAVSCRSIDTLVKELQLAGPFLIKLDTHGYEKPILKGAQETLRHTNVVVIECYLFNVAEDALRLPEMCKYMESQGFRCIDMADPMLRKLDGAWWQVDLVFLRSTDEAFDSDAYE